LDAAVHRQDRVELEVAVGLALERELVRARFLRRGEDDAIAHDLVRARHAAIGLATEPSAVPQSLDQNLSDVRVVRQAAGRGGRLPGQPMVVGAVERRRGDLAVARGRRFVAAIVTATAGPQGA
jgi:hypothetical protein